MDVTAFAEALVSWAKTQTEIVGVALVGSYARDGATKESDVDLIILTADTAKYFENQQWMSLFGEVQKSMIENWGPVETIRVFYRNSFEAEYNFTEPAWAENPIDAGTRRVVTDGMKILHDPKGVLKALQNSFNQTSC
jgi:predicted nucleotidyltransferase